LSDNAQNPPSPAPQAASIATPAKPQRSRWHTLLWYVVLAVIVGLLMLLIEEWWARGFVILIGVLYGIRLAIVDKETNQSLRGHCIACGQDVTADDWECPRCGKNVPREQREKRRR
jgi:predicted nucleic acid-binding Zn ribbon protein